jgi:hypothetical protein
MSKKTVSQLDNLQSLKNEDLMYVSEYSNETTEFTSKNITFEDLKSDLVPYTGATSDVDIGENDLTVGGKTLTKSYNELYNVVADSNASYRIYNNVGMYFYKSVSSIVGYVIIELPKYQSLFYKWKLNGWTHNQGAWSIDFGATFSTTAVTGAGGRSVIVGNCPTDKINILRDTATTKDYIVIGEATTSWTYPIMSLDVHEAFSDYSSLPQEHVITISSTLPSYTSIYSTTASKYSHNTTVQGSVTSLGTISGATFNFPEGGYLSSSPDGKNLIYTNIDNNVAQITNFS